MFFFFSFLKIYVTVFYAVSTTNRDYFCIRHSIGKVIETWKIKKYDWHYLLYWFVILFYFWLFLRSHYWYIVCILYISRHCLYTLKKQIGSSQMENYHQRKYKEIIFLRASTFLFFHFFFFFFFPSTIIRVYKVLSHFCYFFYFFFAERVKVAIYALSRTRNISWEKWRFYYYLSLYSRGDVIVCRYFSLSYYSYIKLCKASWHHNDTYE